MDRGGKSKDQGDFIREENRKTKAGGKGNEKGRR